MSRSDRFTGKVAFVTGAASGIGRATAIAFAAEGARVAILDRTEDALRQTADAIKDTGGEVLVIACDVSVPEAGRGGDRAHCRDVRPTRHRLQQRRCRKQGDAACRDRTRRVGPHPQHQSARNLCLHEA